MLHETFLIRGVRETASLTTYFLDNSPEIDPERCRPTVLVCPGGAYRFTSDREGEAIAIQLNAMGLNAALLRYSCAPVRHPEPICQAAGAMAYLRENSRKFAINPDKLYLMGFSAGGHLAASLGVFWHRRELAELIGKSSELFRPDRLILCYPVITSGIFTHQESLENLTGGTCREKPQLWAQLSLETQVSEKTPPTFLWHTVEDNTVPVENSMLFASALRRNGVPFELHLYQKGLHGLSLGTEEITCKATGYPNQPNVRSWTSLLRTWLME